GAPCADVPLPRGRFVPSGCTLMFHAASSAGVTGVPRPGPAAKAGEEMSSSVATLDVNMAHASVGIDRPARRPVVVLADERGGRQHARALAAVSDHLGARRLRLGGLIPCAREEHRRSAVPLPGNAEARE